jgi:hypothetical protein
MNEDTLQFGNSTEKIEKIYERLQGFWKVNLAAGVPNPTNLSFLHTALCEQEEKLLMTNPDECLANLLARLEAASRLGLELDLPDWARSPLINLRRWLEGA